MEIILQKRGLSGNFLLYNFKMKYFLQNLKNNIDFFTRQIFDFSRKNYSERNESKEGLFATKELIEREKYLFEKFELTALKSNSTRENYLQNLYTIDLLNKHLSMIFKENLKILDIGCKNWFYAKGEYFFFKKYCETLTLDGIELDTNRLYTNFYTRTEVAKFHIKDLNGSKYISGDFLNHKEKYDYFVWILPFVVKEPLLKWGLPMEYFQPEKMLEHAYNSLNNDGQIFIINQGEVEHEVQKALCEKLNINYIPIGEIQSEFVNYKIPRYAILIKK